MGEASIDLLGLPIVMIENIFSYLSFDEIAKNRLVSRAFDEICRRMLNRGFIMIERRHAMALKSVKAQLPRRESERRYHHLSRHCDILTSIETRISMLNMTYSKFIDNGLCCFIPGKVIDEIRRVLSVVESCSSPPRAHEVLQELRDISSMAIEHFDDKISPAFRKRLQQAAQPPPPRPAHSSVLAPLAMRQELSLLRRRTVLNAKLSLFLASQYKIFYKRMMDYKKVAWRQQKTIRELTKRQKDQDASIADLKKRIEECDIKYSELTHTNQAVGGKAIGASGGPDARPPAQPLRHFSSQIKLDLSVLPIGTNKRTNKMLPNMKPRKPLIKLPSLSEDDTEPPQKIQKLDENRLNSPSTSVDRQSPKTKSIDTIAKIRGITNEIRQLTSLSKAYESKLKRPYLNNDNPVPDKKQKLD
ncbi:F-box only protein 28-like [Trichoplusia ni]|uniref:F-box only protein 28-like n=1 Tax=Trichoplusia ni TaxID=7111 RepID=A0A7E5WTJ1_TRINI|nr:F-box only protein 28-like [Trichoplusia ni]XP_026744158.1 F-box only protein 28-like [Trichoplusia ni]